MKRLGPYGLTIRVRFSGHGATRAIERVLRELAINDQAVIRELFTAPKSGRDDAPDPSGDGKIRRWALIQAKSGDLREVRIVFVVNAPTTKTDPGEIEIISVVLENKKT